MLTIILKNFICFCKNEANDFWFLCPCTMQRWNSCGFLPAAGCSDEIPVVFCLLQVAAMKFLWFFACCRLQRWNSCGFLPAAGCSDEIPLVFCLLQVAAMKKLNLLTPELRINLHKFIFLHIKEEAFVRFGAFEVFHVGLFELTQLYTLQRKYKNFFWLRSGATKTQDHKNW